MGIWTVGGWMLWSTVADWNLEWLIRQVWLFYRHVLGHVGTMLWTSPNLIVTFKAKLLWYRVSATSLGWQTTRATAKPERNRARGPQTMLHTGKWLTLYYTRFEVSQGNLQYLLVISDYLWIFTYFFKIHVLCDYVLTIYMHESCIPTLPCLRIARVQTWIACCQGTQDLTHQTMGMLMGIPEW